jgi:hypothetical protein
LRKHCRARTPRSVTLREDSRSRNHLRGIVFVQLWLILLSR